MDEWKIFDGGTLALSMPRDYLRTTCPECDTVQQVKTVVEEGECINCDVELEVGIRAVGE